LGILAGELSSASYDVFGGVVAIAAVAHIDTCSRHGGLEASAADDLHIETHGEAALVTGCARGASHDGRCGRGVGRYDGRYGRRAINASGEDKGQDIICARRTGKEREDSNGLAHLGRSKFSGTGWLSYRALDSRRTALGRRINE